MRVRVKKTLWYYIATCLLYICGEWPLTVTRINGIKSDKLTLNKLIE
jgi:hypothetical protein